MRTIWRIGGIGIIWLTLARPGTAQPPAVPAAPPVPGVPATAATAAPAAPAAPSNIWSMLCPTPEQKAACKEKFCNSFLGKLVKSMTGPVSLYTGGLFGECCPSTPTAADLAKPADSAEGAAARIQEMEAKAGERRAAVRYLGTVDCRRYPEAELALIGALRGDTSECVRYEAALALGKGCCCTRAVMEALSATATGQPGKEYVGERSPRVKQAALAALHNCRARQDPTITEPTRPERPEPAPRELPTEVQAMAPVQPVQPVRLQPIPAPAAVAPVTATATVPAPRIPTGSRSVFDVLTRAAQPRYPMPPP